MSIKLIASDLDGTIGDGEQLKKDAEAIARFRAAGNLFGFVSGRNAGALKAVADWCGIETDFLLSDSGGTCRIGGKTLFCYKAPAVVLAPLADYMMQKNTKLLAINREDGADMWYYRHSDGRVEYNPRRALWTPRDFPQVSGYFASIEECMAVAAELNALFPHLDALPNWSCMDIVPRGRGKAVGVREIAEHFGVDYDHTFVVGDNYNDLPMIDVFRSYIVSSACDEVKAHAREGIVDSVEKMIEIISEEQ